MNYMIYFDNNGARNNYYGPFKSAQAADKWARGSLDAGWVIRALSEPWPPIRGQAAKATRKSTKR